LGLFPIVIIVSKLEQFESIENKEKLNILIRFFEKVAFELVLVSNPYIGSEFKAKPFSDVEIWYKEKSIVVEPENILLENELKDKPWYIYNGYSGTSEERNLIDFLKDTMGNFEAKYEKVFLLRNEEVYKIFDFEKGRGFQPDFLLFLKSSQEEIYYQVFIEPKGSQFEDASGNFKDGKEGWKETFLEQITEKYNNGTALKVENHFYKLVGLPLYNAKKNQDFKKSVAKNLLTEIA